MPPYKELFPSGARVRIAPRQRLEQFKETWRFHHPLTSEQLEFAGQQTKVQKVSFYHGGDVLYTLDGVPGIWHEECLGSPE